MVACGGSSDARSLLQGIRFMTNSDQLTPWFSMWTKPRDTIRQIIDSDDPEKMVLHLAAVGGISSSLSSAAGNYAGDQIPLVCISAECFYPGPGSGLEARHQSNTFGPLWPGRKFQSFGQ